MKNIKSLLVYHALNLNLKIIGFNKVEKLLKKSYIIWKRKIMKGQ